MTRYVLLLRHADWKRYPPRLRTLPPLLDTPELALWRLPDPNPPPLFRGPPAGPILAGDAIALLTALVALGALVVGGWRPGMER